MPVGRGIAALLAGLAVVACQQPIWTQPETTNKARKSVVVQFTDATLHPTVARVLEGGNVVWVNYSSLYVGSVVFPADIESSFTCSELRPLFMKVAAGYQSIPITGSSGEDVALPCPLKPGEYPYTLNLFSGYAAGAGEQMSNPQVTMQGRIIVE